MTVRTIMVVGAAIVDSRGRILAARRGPTMRLAGQWEFPGGKIEEGESPEESLVRELEEELSVTCEVLSFVARGEVVGESRIILDVYRCRIVDGELTPHEHDAIAWLAADELNTVEWAEADWPAVRALSSQEER